MKWGEWICCHSAIKFKPLDTERKVKKMKPGSVWDLKALCLFKKDMMWSLFLLSTERVGGVIRLHLSGEGCCYFFPWKLWLAIRSPLKVTGSVHDSAAHKRLRFFPCLALAITATVERSGDVFKMRPRSLPDCFTEMLSYIYWVSNEAPASSAK